MKVLKDTNIYLYLIFPMIFVYIYFIFNFYIYLVNFIIFRNAQFDFFLTNYNVCSRELINKLMFKASFEMF